ncbi:hypothetical protein FRB94_002999 [Tulasnella sp. JGI-2019a]|nr:hypothetical protein FRB93_004025 [Tulasnella sp. JGI-2019a]KAG9003676.1 hypothetical protein FRB94_002999 [Tulasnella sp. JGI-2019a]KAG9027212.1 hypothetical protein FRB95_007999 [Tulasnella sp. JGI-2019a]
MSVPNIRIDSPLSLYSIPVLYVVALYPQYVKGFLMKAALGGYPNTNPRGNIEKCRKKGISEDIIKKMERAQGAHTNGLETWPVFAISILAANVAGVDHRTTNLFAGGIVVLRIIYNWLYINGTTGRIASLRSLNWTVTMIASLVLVVKAANGFKAV